MHQVFVPGNSLQLLGAIVTVKLTTGEAITGEVFCYDMNGSNTIVLKESIDNDHANFHLIKAQHVREVSAKGVPPPVIADTALPVCSRELLEYRERHGLAQFQRIRHTIGIRVTQEAQDIFDFIHKTHPDCCWENGSRIHVMGVTVSPPYRPEDCEGSGKPLERIKQVLERFIQRRRQDKKKPPLSPHQGQHQPQQQASQLQQQPPSQLGPSAAAAAAAANMQATGMAFTPAPPQGQSVVLIDQHGVPVSGAPADMQGRLYHPGAPAPGLMMMVLPGAPGPTDDRLGHVQAKSQGLGGPIYATTAPGMSGQQALYDAGGGPPYRGPLVFAAPGGGGQMITVPGPASSQQQQGGGAGVGGPGGDMNGVATMIPTMGAPAGVADLQGRAGGIAVPAGTYHTGESVYGLPPDGSVDVASAAAAAAAAAATSYPGCPSPYRSPTGPLGAPNSHMPPPHHQMTQPPGSARSQAGRFSNTMPPMPVSPQIVQGSPQQTGGPQYNSQYKHPRWNQGHGNPGGQIPPPMTTLQGGDGDGPSPTSTPTSANGPSHGSMESGMGPPNTHSGPTNGAQRGGKGGRTQRNRGNRRRE